MPKLYMLRGFFDQRPHALKQNESIAVLISLKLDVDSFCFQMVCGGLWEMLYFWTTHTLLRVGQNANLLRIFLPFWGSFWTEKWHQKLISSQLLLYIPLFRQWIPVILSSPLKHQTWSCVVVSEQFWTSFLAHDHPHSTTRIYIYEFWEVLYIYMRFREVQFASHSTKWRYMNSFRFRMVWWYQTNSITLST
jgi:hypothetical protein